MLDSSGEKLRAKRGAQRKHGVPSGSAVRGHGRRHGSPTERKMLGAWRVRPGRSEEIGYNNDYNTTNSDATTNTCILCQHAHNGERAPSQYEDSNEPTLKGPRY